MLLLMALFSPSYEHADYEGGGFERHEWVSAGPLRRVVSGRGVERLMKPVIRKKVRDVARAEGCQAFPKDEWRGERPVSGVKWAEGREGGYVRMAEGRRNGAE